MWRDTFLLPQGGNGTDLVHLLGEALPSLRIGRGWGRGSVRGVEGEEGGGTVIDM